MEREHQLLNTVRKLVSDDRSVDVESGMCRFCGAIVEDHVAGRVEGHKRSCPWDQVRRLLGVDHRGRPTHNNKVRSRRHMD